MTKKINKETVFLPKQGKSKKEILQLLDEYGKNDPNYKKHETWSLVYYLGEEHTQFLIDVFGKFFRLMVLIQLFSRA